MHEVLSASVGAHPGDVVVCWQATFELIVIEVRGGRVYVNGDLVERTLDGSNASSGSAEQATLSARDEVIGHL